MTLQSVSSPHNRQVREKERAVAEHENDGEDAGVCAGKGKKAYSHQEHHYH